MLLPWPESALAENTQSSSFMRAAHVWCALARGPLRVAALSQSALAAGHERPGARVPDSRPLNQASGVLFSAAWRPRASD